MNKDISEKLVSETRRWVDLANKKMNILFPYPRVKTDLRGTTAGLAYSMYNLIRYNAALAKDNEEAFFARTVPHEVAHLVADFYFGERCNHGPKWKYVMNQVFGLEATRCHSYDVSGHRMRRVMRYKYQCGCADGCVVGPKHQKKILSKMATLWCKKCNHFLNESNFVEGYQEA